MNKSRVERLARQMTRKVSRQCLQDMRISDKSGFDELKSEFERATEIMDLVDSGSSGESHDRVLDHSWASIRAMLNVKYAVKSLKDRIADLRAGVRILMDTKWVSERKIKRADVLIQNAMEIYGPDSPEVLFADRGRGCVVQAIAARRAALSNAKKDLREEKWDCVDRGVDAAFNADREADGVLQCMEMFIFPPKNRRGTKRAR